MDIDPSGIVVIFDKKQEKIWGGSKIRNKLCIKNEVFHVYALNKILSCTKFTRSIHTHVLIDCQLTALFE